MNMQTFPEYVMQRRNDVRLLRLDKDRLSRVHEIQKDKAQWLEKQVKEQAKRIKELEKENEQLKREQEQSSKTNECIRCFQTQIYDSNPLWLYKLPEVIFQGFADNMQVPILALDYLKDQRDIQGPYNRVDV